MDRRNTGCATLVLFVLLIDAEWELGDGFTRDRVVAEAGATVTDDPHWNGTPLKESIVLRKCSQIVAIGVICSVVGCSGSTSGPNRAWSTHFTGRVQIVDGTTVPQAKVTVQGIDLDGSTAVSRGKCTGGVVYPVAGQTGSDGRYDLAFQGGGPPIFACMFVDVTAVVAGKTLSGTIEIDSIRVGPTGLATVPVDVVTIRP